MATTENEPDEELERLLNYLRDTRGFDFTGYKRASLTRRIHRRMQLLGVDDYNSYTSVLEANPGEFAELFDTILINVTAFMRDKEAWDFIASDVLPVVSSNRGPEDPIRVWSVGTASGKEAYTLAVLLAEEVGEDRFRSTVKIYATDADESALSPGGSNRTNDDSTDRAAARSDPSGTPAPCAAASTADNPAEAAACLWPSEGRLSPAKRPTWRWESTSLTPATDLVAPTILSACSPETTSPCSSTL